MIMFFMSDADFYQSNYLKLRRKRDGSIKSCGLIFITVLLVVVLYLALQFKSYQDFLKYKTPNNETFDKQIEIKQGDTPEFVALKLVNEGVIPNKTIFTIPAYKLYLKVNASSTSSLQIGSHQVPRDATIEQIFTAIQKPREGCTEIKVILREGWRIEEYADELDKKFKDQVGSRYNKQEFIKLTKNYIQSPDTKLSFTPPANLEGYLFPDTYNFCSEITTQQIVNTLLSTFDKKVYEPLKDEIASSRFKLNEVVNLAAMVEREVRTYEVKRNVANIIIKRLDNGIPLGIDATSQYQVGYSNTQKTWWVKGTELDQAVLVDNKYNTRKNLGLPPTPIANPGVDSIRAVLNPQPNEYLFYITSDDGKIHYAKTLAEHNYNTCKYLYRTCR
jgi:UPF0755 protein